MHIATVRLIAKLYVPERPEKPEKTPRIDQLLDALTRYKGKGNGYAVVVAPDMFTSDLVIESAEVLDSNLPKVVRKTACSRTDPDKVERLIREGANVMIPVSGPCTACRQPWDRSHMMVIYDDYEAAPPPAAVKEVIDVPARVKTCLAVLDQALDETGPGSDQRGRLVHVHSQLTEILEAIDGKQA